VAPTPFFTLTTKEAFKDAPTPLNLTPTATNLISSESWIVDLPISRFVQNPEVLGFDPDSYPTTGVRS
jgi:hypothetical protein